MLNALIALGAFFGFVIILLLVLASLVTLISGMDDAYDDLHAEKEYLDDYKAKRR